MTLKLCGNFSKFSSENQENMNFKQNNENINLNCQFKLTPKGYGIYLTKKKENKRKLKIPSKLNSIEPNIVNIIFAKINNLKRNQFSNKKKIENEE